MQFYEFQTSRNVTGLKDVPSEDFYKEVFSASMRMQDKRTAFQAISEGLWDKLRRPYYNVYPSITPMLARLSLDVDTRFIHPPFHAFCVRFPVEKPALQFDWGNEKWHVRTILVGPTALSAPAGFFGGAVLWVDVGEYKEVMGRRYPIYTYVNLPMQEGMTLEESLGALPSCPSAFTGVQMPDEVRIACARIVCSICLLENDPSLIEPDVLSKDRGKEMTQTVIDRAHRRGKLGWNIGQGIEKIPHVRRPHPALVHTGPGRTIPKVVLRKGSVVHRDTVTRIPTGFESE